MCFNMALNIQTSHVKYLIYYLGCSETLPETLPWKAEV